MNKIWIIFAVLMIMATQAQSSSLIDRAGFLNGGQLVNTSGGQVSVDSAPANGFIDCDFPGYIKPDMKDDCGYDQMVVRFFPENEVQISLHVINRGNRAQDVGVWFTSQGNFFWVQTSLQPLEKYWLDSPRMRFDPKLPRKEDIAISFSDYPNREGTEAWIFLNESAIGRSLKNNKPVSGSWITGFPSFVIVDGKYV